ncbi:unnamed protein product [Cunninghamella blakesleeana]
MIMVYSKEKPFTENNKNRLNSKKKPTLIKPYETELINNNDDLFKETTYNTRSKRFDRNRPFTARSNSTYYSGDNNRNDSSYKKRKHYHTKSESNIFIDQNDNDFQEIQAYIDKQTKDTKKEIGKEKDKNVQYNSNRSKKCNKIIVDDSDDSDSKNFLKPYGIKNKGLKSSSTTTSTKSTKSFSTSFSPFIILQGKSKYEKKEPISSESTQTTILLQSNSRHRKELSPPSPFHEVNRKKNSVFYARKNRYNTNKQYPTISYNKQDDTTSDSDSTTDDELKGKKNKINTIKERFVLPEKRSKKNTFLFTPLPTFSDPFQHEKSVECPYCHTFINIEDSNIVSEAYKKIKNIKLDLTSINHKSNNNTDDDGDQYNSKNSLSIKPAKPFTSNMELYDFCRLHTSELNIKPYCIKKGWPVTILFDDLEERIHVFKDDLDKIIHQKMDSYYRTIALEAYQEMGKHKARSTMGMLVRFEKTMPGYYGAKGSYIIQNILVKMYLHKGILNKELTSPQLPIEYIQQVLVPEVGYRLIREDLIKDGKNKPNDPNIDDEAKIIMTKSSEAGSYLHPLTDDIDDSALIDDSYDILNISSGSSNEEEDNDDTFGNDIRSFIHNDKNIKKQIHLLTCSDDDDDN